MADVKAQIAGYLELLKMKYLWNEKESSFELIFTERKDGRPIAASAGDTKSQFNYTVKVKISEKWVQVSSNIIPIDAIPEEKRLSLLTELMSSNRKFPEVCYDIDEPRRMIGTSQETLLEGLNFDTFRAEFLAVPWSVRNFWADSAKRYGLV